jgi:hypothetical protein
MTLTHLALISIGNIVLACTFVLGVLVGISLQARKESRNGYEGKGSDWWHRIERERAEECARRGRCGGGKDSPGAGERPHR